jgi:hypothetical protein
MEGVKDMALAQVPQNDPGLLMIERMVADPAVDVTKLQALMDMRNREMTRLSEQAFNVAMSAAQTAMRPIAADATNPSTRSRYASYDKLDRGLRPIYTANGFALSFDTVDSPLPDHVRVICYVTHAAGFARTYRCDMPSDGKGAKGNDVMTKTHAVGAAMSYGMRYLLKMIFNVAVGEDDVDGNQAKPNPKEPTGYPDWLAHMTKLVDGGCNRLALNAAWEASDEAFTRYLVSVDRVLVESWKSKANAVTRAGK